jgi:hypothetical protein
MPEPSSPSEPGGRTPPPAEPDAVAALARQVDRLQQALNAADVPALRRDVRVLAGTVAGVADQVAELAEAGAGSERPAPSWLWPVEVGDPVLAVSVAEQLLSGLVEWVQRVYLQFDDARLPECWLWHPAVVEELVWLWWSWRAAYRSQAATVQRAGDWHDRQRPGVARRIRAAAGSCSLREHLDPALAPAVPTADAAPAVAAWRAVPGRPAPVPTDEQIRAADAAVGAPACTGGGWR